MNVLKEGWECQNNKKLSLQGSHSPKTARTYIKNNAGDGL